MSRSLKILIGVLVFGLVYRFTMPIKGIQSISKEELKIQLGNKRKQFIDVRTPREFEKENITGFKNIPLQDLSDRMDELSKDKEVLVICQRGTRSRKASQLLEKNGFAKVTNIKGGISSYY